MSWAQGLLVAAPMLFGTVAIAQDDTPEKSHAELMAELEQIRDDLQEEREAFAKERESVLAMREALLEEQAALSGDGDRVSYGDTVLVVHGEVVETVVAFGNDVHVSGHVLGDATAFGGDVVVASTGVVDGSAVSFGGEIDIEPGGLVHGDRVDMDMPDLGLSVGPVSDAPTGIGAITGATDVQGLLSTLYRRLILLLSFSGAGVLVIGLFPKRIARIASALEAKPMRAAVVGTFASFFLALFSLTFTLVTLGLGLPVSMVLIGALGLAWLLGFVGLCQVVGDRLPFEQKPHGRWVAFLVGAIMLSCMGSLPAIGWLVVIAASVVGIGAAFSTRFGGR